MAGQDSKRRLPQQTSFCGNNSSRTQAFGRKGNTMRKYLAAAVLIVLVAAATAQARVDFNVNIGVPVVPVPAAAVTYQGYAPQVAYAEQPGFIYSPRLGFYVSVGLPYDVVYLDSCYYHYRGGRWYMSPSYGGNWSYVSPRRLPQQLHRHHYDQIAHYRDTEYRRYQRDRDHYRGHWHRPAAMHGRDRWDDRWDHDRDRYRGKDGYRDRDHERGRR